MEVKPKKYLGQHFLLDKTVSQRIADAINIKPTLNLLEIGIGSGCVLLSILKEIFPHYNLVLKL